MGWASISDRATSVQFRLVPRQGHASLCDPFELADDGQPSFDTTQRGLNRTSASTRRARNSGGYGGRDFGIVGPFSQSGWDATNPGQLQLHSADEAVSAIVHESSHVRSLQLGRPTNTIHDEYMAFRRDFLAEYSRRPNFAEQSKLWLEVKKSYSHLELGKVPALFEEL